MFFSSGLIHRHIPDWPTECNSTLAAPGSRHPNGKTTHLSETPATPLREGINNGRINTLHLTRLSLDNTHQHHSPASTPFPVGLTLCCHSGIVWTARSTLLLIRSRHWTTILPGHPIASRRGGIVSKPNHTRRSDIPFREHREATLTQFITPLHRTPPSGKAASHNSPVNSYSPLSVKSATDRTLKRFPQQKTPKERRIAPRAIHLFRGHPPFSGPPPHRAPRCHPPLPPPPSLNLTPGVPTTFVTWVRSDGATHRSGTRNQSRLGHTQLARPKTGPKDTTRGPHFPC